VISRNAHRIGFKELKSEIKESLIFGVLRIKMNPLSLTSVTMKSKKKLPVPMIKWKKRRKKADKRYSRLRIPISDSKKIARTPKVSTKK